MASIKFIILLSGDVIVCYGIIWEYYTSYITQLIDQIGWCFYTIIMKKMKPIQQYYVFIPFLLIFYPSKLKANT